MIAIKHSFILLQTTINNGQITLINLYAPNTRQHSFLREIRSKLKHFAQGHIILGGDFNDTPNPILDSTNKACKRSFTLSSFITDTNLFDAWRYLHGNEKDYTLFSKPQHSYSRIDLFLVNKLTLHHISKTEIDSITWSDHAPVSLEMFVSPFKKNTSLWHLNTSLLTNPRYKDKDGCVREKEASQRDLSSIDADSNSRANA